MDANIRGRDGDAANKEKIRKTATEKEGAIWGVEAQDVVSFFLFFFIVAYVELLLGFRSFCFFYCCVRGTFTSFFDCVAGNS